MNTKPTTRGLASKQNRLPAMGGDFVVDVFVLGEPQVQGNLSISYSKNPNKKSRLYYQNDAVLKKWKKAIKREICAEVPPGRYDGPLYIRITFFLPMPAYKKKAYDKGRLPHLWKTEEAFDLDKLVRAVFDAVKDSERIKDDGQFVQLAAEKGFARVPGSEGARIQIIPAGGG